MIILCSYRLRNYGVSPVALQDAVVPVSFSADFTFSLIFSLTGRFVVVYIIGYIMFFHRRLYL
jgi:hypothetical protein